MAPSKKMCGGQEISGSVYLVTSDGRVLSLPIPSNSPRDPLNWSVKKRILAFSTLLLYSVMGLTIVQGPSLLFGPLAAEYNRPDGPVYNIELLLSIPTLFMGIGAFIWIPLSMALGRRPTFLLCHALLLSATVWAGSAGSFYSHMAATALQGLAEGFSTSTILLMVIDLTFIHQRPTAIAAVWAIVGFLTSFILALVPQMTKNGIAWRSFYNYYIIPITVSFLLTFFYYPETYFHRPAVAFDGRILVQSASENVKIYDDWDKLPSRLAQKDGMIGTVSQSSSQATKNSSRSKEDPYLEETPWETKRRELKWWGLIPGGFNAMARTYPQILLCAFNPLVFWVALLGAVQFGAMLSIGSTYSTLLLSPPYSMDIKVIALVNLAGAAGSLLSWPASGFMIARISRGLALNNGGVRESEHYLPAFVLPVIAGTASVVVYGLAAENKWPAMWVYISYLLNTFAFAGMSTASTLWVTEAFPRWAAAAVTILIGGSYSASFGLTFAVLPWVKSQGFAGCNIEIGVLLLSIGFIGVPVAFWGKQVRQYLHGRWADGGSGGLRPQSPEEESEGGWY